MKPPAGTRAVVALGANLGDARSALAGAFDALAELPATKLLARSSLYRTAPIDAPGQPDYLNAVAMLDTELPAAELLTALHEIEALHGRVRSTRNAARTLDLDLLLHGESCSSDATLTLPHPRMHLRAFVLHPLAEIAPDTWIPGHGRAFELLATVADQRIERLND